MEIWKDIKGFEGLYQVSNFGNVRSVERKVANKNGAMKLYKSKVIKPCTNQANCGHLHLGLHKNGRTKTCYVHRLVAQHFVPNPKNLNVVNHKDYDTTNNKAENLEWCTQQENARYSSERMKKPKQKCKSTNTGEKYIRKSGNKYAVLIKGNHYIYKSFDSLSEAIAFRNEVI